MNSAIGNGFVLGALAIAAFGGLAGIVGGITRREQLYAWVRWAAIGFFACMLLANLTMIFALLTHDFTVKYVAQVGSRQTPTIFTLVSLWSALEGSILFWGLIMGAYVFAFTLTHRRERPHFVTLALGVMLSVGVFFAFLIAGPANPFLPTAPQVLEGIRAAGDGPGPNPLLQNHILMIIHPPFLYLGYVGMTVPFGISMAGLIAGEMGESWMAPLRRWTMIPWMFLSCGIIFGAWWAYAVLGWGGYWAWDPVENASFLPWLTATAFMHSTMVLERRRILKLWTVALALGSFWLTLLGTFMTRSGVFNSVHSFTQSDIGPTFLVFLAIVAVVSIVTLGVRGHLLTPEGRVQSVASREIAMLVNNLLFAAFTFMVLLGTTYPLIKEGLFNKRISVGEPYFNLIAVPIGLLILLLMGVGPALPWGRADAKKFGRELAIPAIVGVITFGLSLLVVGKSRLTSGSSLLAPLTFGLAAFTALVTLRQMFLPAWVRVREKHEGVVSAVLHSATRARRRFGGYIVHLGIVVIIVSVAASRSYSTHTSGTIGNGQSLSLSGYTLTYDGQVRGREPHRTYTGAKLSVTSPSGGTTTLVPRMNFYERSTDPIGTPAVWSRGSEDLYISLMAFDEQANNASFKVWVFPMVGWIWYALPILVLGSLIALWPSRKSKVSVASGSAPTASSLPPVAPPVAPPAAALVESEAKPGAA